MTRTFEADGIDGTNISAESVTARVELRVASHHGAVTNEGIESRAALLSHPSQVSPLPRSAIAHGTPR